MKVTLVGIVNTAELKYQGKQNELTPMLSTEVAKLRVVKALLPRKQQ